MIIRRRTIRASAALVLVLSLARTGAPARDAAGAPKSSKASTGASAPSPTTPAGEAVALFPPASRTEEVVDRLHGVDVPDPYRWLEDDRSPEVRDWTEAQNSFTKLVLSAVPDRERIGGRLGTLLRIGTIDSVVARGSRYFFLMRSGDQNQPVLYVQEGSAGTPRPLVDPNTLSADGTVALDWWAPSKDGALLAYGTSRNGDEWSTLRVREVTGGADRSDEIPRTRACSVAWLPDGTGFYYTRYPQVGDVPRGEENYHRKVYFHPLGTDWKLDPLIFGEGRAREEWPNVQLSPDGRWLLVLVEIGWERSEVYLRDRAATGAVWKPLVEKVDALYQAEPTDDALYLATNDGAPRWKVLRVDPLAPERAGWKEIVPEGPDALRAMTFAAGRLFLHYLHDAASVVRVVSPDGVPLRDLALPVRGSVTTINGEADGREAFLGFHSYFVPPVVYRCDPDSGALTVFRKVDTDLNTSGYELNQVWYPSKDGTKVSMFLVHRKGLKKTGQHPVLLTGYGGFNQPLTPGFQRNSFLWLEQGGVLAVANLRGGSEYGEAWHRGGMLDKKQNSFDDFIAAAQYLVRQKYTSSSKLVIQGGSNGGLLVGAALVQKPELFRAVVCQVPLLDMLRYHTFLVARLWIPEYGSADDPGQFEFLRRYSPYHNVKDGTAYPAVLLSAAESDSRVAPLHARKMAARLQAASSSGRPVLLRIETKAGHGAGKPVQKLVDEYTDLWSFVFSQVGLTYTEPKPAAAAQPAARKPAAKKPAAKTAPSGTTRKKEQ